jgi:hypothetical protein
MRPLDLSFGYACWWRFTERDERPILVTLGFGCFRKVGLAAARVFV